MRHRTVRSLIVALVLAANAAAAPDTPPAAGNKAGNITALLPTANIVRGPAKQPVTVAAKKGDEVIWNDLVRTDKGGRARITLLDQSILSVGSQAELRIIKSDAKSQQTSIEVGYGRVRMEVTPITRQGGSFEVKTPTAVAGVIGTLFGIDSAIGATTFLCLSGTVMVGSNDPNIPGRVPCTAGMAAVVSAGKAPATRPATQQEIQQFVQDTEPAVISAINPSSLLPGTTADVTITGTQLGNVNAVSSSASSVTATLNAGGTATSVSAHVVVAATATPGPVTLTFSKPSGVSSAAVFSVLAPPSTAAAAGGDYKQPFLNTIEQERQSAIAGLNGLGVGLAQSADQAYNQISAANSALNPPLDISQAVTDLKGPVNAEMNAATNDGTAVNQAAQTAVTSFTGLYNTAWQALVARVPTGAPDNQFQNDLTSAFNQVNSTLLAGFAAAQADLGQQVQAQNTIIQQITNTWLARIQQVAQSQAPPSIKGLSSTAAPSTGGVTVTITGANFDPNTKVMFGSVAASNVIFVSSTQLNVIVPPGSPGTVDLTVVTGSGLSTTLSGGFNFGGPVPAITPPDITVNPGVQVVLDGSRSSDTLAGTTLTYSWTFCSLGFKPPQVGAVLPAMSAPLCTAAPGTVSGTDSQFSLTPPVTAGQYFARLQVTDNLGGSAVIFSSVTVSQPTYDDPATRTASLAQAFAGLQPQGVLAFFDSSYPNLTGLQAALQSYVKTLRSLTANVQIVPPNITGTTAVLQVTWQLQYSYINACPAGAVSCQPPSYALTATESYVWTLTPGKGWFITQGSLPTVPDSTSSSPDLEMEGVVAQGIPGNPIPIGLGAQSFVATVKNIGTAASTQTTLHFELKQLDGTLLGSTNPDPVLAPLGAGASGTVIGTITVPNLTAVTQAQLVATANPGCVMTEKTCGNDAGTFQVVITPPTVALPNLVTKITNVASGATLGTGPQTIQATVTNNGNATFSASPPVNFAVAVAGNTVASTQVTITGPIAVSQAVNVQGNLTIPTTIPAGTPATLTVDASPTCPSPVEPDCTDNTVSLPIVIGIPPAIIITSSQGNTSSANPVELNGLLTDTLTLTATRSDSITTGSVTLTLASAPEVSSSPSQLTAVPYNSPQAVDFTATINASGNVSAVPTTVVVTPSQAVPAAGSTPTTLYFNVGDINLTGVPSCILVTPGGGQTQLNLGFQLVNGFNAPNLSWQWSALTAGVSVNIPSGSAAFSGNAYNPSLPAFIFTNSNTGDISGPQTFLFAVTVSSAQGGSSATKVFALTFGLSGSVPCGQAVRVGGGVVNGVWSRGVFGGGMARAARPAPAVALPDLQINASSVSFTPSIPNSGDTVAVRFRVTNAGNADAQRVPISLVVNGTAVASDTFDVRAGASTLASLEWTNAHAPSGSRGGQASVVVDPSHTVPQKSALGKSVPLAHFAFLPASGGLGGSQLTSVLQRATLEAAEGSCVGFRFASGAGSACGSADVEITVEQLAGGRFTLAAQNGIADLGTAFGGGRLAGVQYQQEVPAVAGHSYAVRLGGGKTGILRLMAIRNPARTSAKGRQVFGAGKVASSVGGATTGPVETGDVSGVRAPSQPKAYFEVSYQTQ